MTVIKISSAVFICLIVPTRSARNATFVHQAVGGIKQAGNKYSHGNNNLNNVSEIALFHDGGMLPCGHSKIKGAY